MGSNVSVFEVLLRPASRDQIIEAAAGAVVHHALIHCSDLPVCSCTTLDKGVSVCACAARWILPFLFLFSLAADVVRMKSQQTLQQSQVWLHPCCLLKETAAGTHKKCVALGVLQPSHNLLLIT